MKFASVFGHKQIERKFQPWDGWPLPKCKIGLEWEFESATATTLAVARDGALYLTVQKDGSLRDNGAEISTTGDGLYGEDLIDCINLLDSLAKIGMPTCNYRTGFHVHIDIRDMEEKELHNMLLLYCMLERPIFNFVGRDRWKNNFCVPWFRSDTQFGILKEIALSADVRTAEATASKVKGLQRYAALNCQSIAKFGTLEFRHMENNLDEITTKQVEFIRLIMKIKKMAVHVLKDRGLYGPTLWQWLKEIRPDELIRYLKHELPMTDWDYPETLMAAASLVTFPEKELQFFDAVFDNFIGTPANWR